MLDMRDLEVQLFDYDSMYSESKSCSSYWNRGWNIGEIVSVDRLTEEIKLKGGVVSFVLYWRNHD